jgi:hypothetical protein
MTDEKARPRNAENSERFALRRAERSMAAEALELDRALDTLAGDLEKSEEKVGLELRKEHWGH